MLPSKKKDPADDSIDGDFSGAEDYSRIYANGPDFAFNNSAPSGGFGIARAPGHPNSSTVPADSSAVPTDTSAVPAPTHTADALIDYGFSSVDNFSRVGADSFDFAFSHYSYGVSAVMSMYFGGFYTAPRHWASHTISVNISELTAPEQALATTALKQWADVAPLTFTFTDGPADITYVDSGSGNIATMIDTVPVSSSDGLLHAETIDISTDWFNNDGGALDGLTGIDSYDFQTYLAATGRALGLNNQGGTDTYTNADPVDPNAIIFGFGGHYIDSWQFPVTSYFPNRGYTISPDTAGIKAIQSLYGATDARPGDTVYGFHSTAGAIYDFASYTGLGTPYFTIYDTGGTNTLDASGFAMGQVIDLNYGSSSSIGGGFRNVTIYTTTKVQNAIGGSGDDLIIPNQSLVSTLTGGGGNNIFEGTFSTLSGDTVTDMHAGDRIRFIDGTAVYGFGFKRDGATLTYANINGLHSLTLSNSPAGHFVPTPFWPDGPAIDLVLMNPTSTSDFSDSGTSDILWRGGDGTLVDWTMNDGKMVGSSTLAAAPDSTSSIAAIADFNGDGHSDILWRTTDGTLVEWKMNGSTIESDRIVGHADPSWSIAGAADFDGDGHADLLWRNSDGRLVEWSATGDSAISLTPDPSWNIAGIGDFDGDGKSDILWRNANGTLGLWSMDGASITREETLGAAPDASWRVAGIGDFNGDGKSDILWRNDNGTLGEWLMDGAEIMGVGAIAAAPDASWSLVQVGDFNGDGKSDLLWRQDTTGTTVDWLMDGARIASNQTIATSSDGSWQIQAKPTNSAV